MTRIPRSEAIFSESAPDPRRRPSVDMLLGKMRKLSSLQNKPEAVLLVVDDMLHHYFMEEEKRPAHLWQIMQSCMYKWQILTGGQNLRDYNQHTIMEMAGLPPPSDIFQYYFQLQQTGMPIHDPNAGFATGGNVGDSPVKDPLTEWTPIDLEEFLKENRGEVESVIETHMYRYASNECDCGKHFATHKEWARHLRIHIWRYLNGTAGA